MADFGVPKLLHEIAPQDPGWVMVLETEQATRDLTHLLLRQLTPMPVALCHSAAVAAGLLRQRARPTLCVVGVKFMDQETPAVLRALRDKFEGTRTRIVLLSAMPRHRVGDLVMEFRPFVTLHKPIEIDELRRALAGALDAVEDSVEMSQELLEDISAILDTDDDLSGEISFGDLYEVLKRS